MTAIAVSRRTALFCAIAALSLAGCSTQETHHYTLATYALPAVPAVTGGPAITVGVGPVSLPDYIDRDEIVLRLSDYRVDLLTFELWAAPLQQRFPQVLVADMQTQMPFARVVAFPPLMPTPADVQIEVDVQQFDIDVAGTAVLIANWRLRGPGGQPLTAAGSATSGQAQVTANATGATMPARVAALSEAVAKLGRVLADAVLALPPTTLQSPAQLSPTRAKGS
jgi:uncharacterized lipoprotein YmbA